MDHCSLYPFLEEAEEGEKLGILCVRTGRKIIGLDLDKLREGYEEVKNVDWGSRSSPPFVFSFHLRHRDSPLPLGMRPFTLGSNTYLAGGFHPTDEAEKAYNKAFLTTQGEPNYEIYETQVVFDENCGDYSLRVIQTNSLLRPPAPLAGSYVVNMLGNFYFFQDHSLIEEVTDGLLVLDSRDKEWKWLRPPPPLVNNLRSFSFYADCFPLHDKLFIHCYLNPCKDDIPGDDDNPIYAFDPKTECWTREHCVDQDTYHILHSFCLGIDEEEFAFSFPKITVSVPNFTKGTIVLTSSRNTSTDTNSPELRIYALMVNQNGVMRYQSLDESFKGFQPPFISWPECFLIDLGNSTVCALIYGSAYEFDYCEILHISIFTLAEALQPETETDTDAPPPKEQRFLSVHVLGKYAYVLNDEDTPVIGAFACQPKKIPKMIPKKG